MFVVVFKNHGELNCEQKIYGPYEDYTAAEDALGNGAVPLLYGQGGREWPGDIRPLDGYRYIAELSD